MLYTTTSCKKGGQKRASAARATADSKRHRLLGSFSLKFAVVKATSPDKSEGLRSTKEPVLLRSIILQTQSGMSATGNIRQNLPTTRFY